MAKNCRSIEEYIEDWAKRQLESYFTKTDNINPQIDNALKTAPSKRGGKGTNVPDIKMLIEVSPGRRIPVMIEIKGLKDALVKLDSNNRIENKTKDEKPNYGNIAKYAVNGAVHYSEAVLKYSDYEESLAVGVNGYLENGSETPVIEIGAYYLSKDNFFIPRKIADFSDLSFLKREFYPELVSKLDSINLTEKEIEEKARSVENQIELQLKQLNQLMQDDLKISEGARVELVAGMILAALGVKDRVSPLTPEDLRGENTVNNNDGQIIIRKIEDFLHEKNLPEEKKSMIVNDLKRVFVFSRLSEPVNGESKLKTIYTFVKNKVMPIFTSARHLDFTGKLFNVLNDWVDIPDSSKNDVVLTPRYITDFMAKLAEVDMTSYVWDYAVGTAGFLVSSMKLMIKDATERISSPEKLAEKIRDIKTKQLLGVELRSDIYLLAVLNMILMGDGSANIIHKNSLTEFEGNYEQGDLRGTPFPANVFLLNPPYSASGKGFVFVEKALSRMSSGRAVVLIQENGGTRAGLPYTRNILENNTLVASIHMADIFKGKAGVQTAVYVFDIGVRHNVKSIVKFIDFSNDGYTRQNRKKATQRTNLRDTDHAAERYEEVVNLVLYGDRYLNFFQKDINYIEDTISLNGDDWTFQQHVKHDLEPKMEDYLRTIGEYLSWKESVRHGGNMALLYRRYPLIDFWNANTDECDLTDLEKKCYRDLVESTFNCQEFNAGDLFSVDSTPQLNKDSFVFDSYSGCELLYPYFTRTVENNGIAGYVRYLDDEHKISGNSIAVGMLQMKFFYMESDFYAGQFTKYILPKDSEFDTLDDGLQFNENIALYFITWFNRNSDVYKASVVREFVNFFNTTKVLVPVTAEGKVDVRFIDAAISATKKILRRAMSSYWSGIIAKI